MEGHYSNGQWKAFATGRASAPEQMLEHLTKCERCMAAYTAILQQSGLATPPRGMAEEILSRVKPQKTVVAVLPQMLKLLLSATLAAAVWIGSSVLIPPDANRQAAQTRAEQQAARIDQKIQRQQQRMCQPEQKTWIWQELLTGKGGE